MAPLRIRGGAVSNATASGALPGPDSCRSGAEATAIVEGDRRLYPRGLAARPAARPGLGASLDNPPHQRAVRGTLLHDPANGVGRGLTPPRAPAVREGAAGPEEGRELLPAVGGDRM